nr:MAG TPA: hypothetical protein [Caudoviricetes sp.]
MPKLLTDVDCKLIVSKVSDEVTRRKLSRKKC